ncbi:MAG: T9SS type A sorting domain-containing protein [Flavobacteriales bacterium]|nr:T9SS type A sorting domain-containing protein [Flavobacteriales bacterium]
MLRSQPLILLALTPVALIGQEHPFLGGLTLQEQAGTVLLEWTLTGGSTCNGIQIERAYSGQGFVQIGEIHGLCGDLVDPVDYSWNDVSVQQLSSPSYRLKLGVDGYSSVKSITLMELNENEQLLFPIPAEDRVTLLLRLAPQTPFDLRVQDLAGRVVLDRRGISGGRVSWDVRSWLPGTYIYAVQAEGRRYAGKLVIL